MLTLDDNTTPTSTNYTYDNNGNVISIQEDGANKFRTIHENRNLPIFVEFDDSTEAIYLYNADGQRIFKKVETDTAEHYIMDGSQNIGLIDANGSLTYWNLVANGTMGRMKANGDKLFYIKDHLGSTRSVVNTIGNVVEILDYYPFRLFMPRQAGSPSVETKEQFTGKELDAETGLFHIVWRKYDPMSGRFTIVDPFADQYLSLSPFSYVRNNPIIFIDPQGLEWFYHQAEGEDEARWHFHEDTPEKEIWTGEYDEEGNKIMQTVKGLESLLSVEAGELVFLDAYGEIIYLGELDELEFPIIMQVYDQGKVEMFGPSEPQIGYLPFGPGGGLKLLSRINKIRLAKLGQLSDWIRFGNTIIPPQVVGKGATKPIVTWVIKGGGKNPRTGFKLPFHYHIHKYNLHKPWQWFKYTSMK